MDGRVKESGSFLFLSRHIFFRAAAPAISKSAKLCDFSSGKDKWSADLGQEAGAERGFVSGPSVLLLQAETYT